MRFKDIIGQEELKQRLIDLANKNHLPHAMMLLEQAGSGGLPMALALVQFMMCEQKSSDDSCGDCAPCTKNAKLQHPDVHFSFPTFKKEPTKIPVSNDFIVDFRNYVSEHPYGNDFDWLKSLGTEKQGNITATECRDIIKKLQLRSFESEYKFLIMWYPEYMGGEGNILLKLIEEPTAKTIIIFVSSTIEKVLLTIQSRTQLFPLKKLQVIDIQNGLIAKGVEASKALQLARLSDGNYFQAIKMIDSNDDDLTLMLRNWLNCIYANKGLDLVTWIGEIAEKTKDNQRKFLLYFTQLLEHTIRTRQGATQSLHLLESEQNIVNILIAKKLSDQVIEKIANLVDDSIYQIERNANTKILFHSLSLRIQQMIMAQKAVA